MQVPRLREWRQRRGLIQAELAQAAGVSVRSVAGYEAGGGIRPTTARKVAAALELAVEDLLDLAHAAGDSYPPVLDISNADFKELVEGLDYDQAGDLMRELMDWLDEYKQGQPTFRSIEEISEYTRTHRMEEIRAMRAGGRAVTLFKWRRSIAEEEKTRLEGLVTEEQAAELATA